MNDELLKRALAVAKDLRESVESGRDQIAGAISDMDDLAEEQTNAMEDAAAMIEELIDELSSERP